MEYMGKTGMVIAFILVVAVLTAGILWFVNGGTSAILPNGTSSGTPTLVLNAPSGTASGSGQSTSDGTINFTVPSDFGLAVSQQQILVRSYIPPCDPDFNYCLYYNGSAYKGTNFESAGIRINKRTDLTGTSACLNTPPTGYTDFTPTSTTAADYSIAEFTPLGNAGAGHYAIGTLYRVWYNGNNSCYEFETRIGQTQFANYPSGSVQKFTTDNQAAVQAEMMSILNGVTLPSGEAIGFPR